MKEIFEFDNYLEFMRHLISLNSEQRGFQARLAGVMGCQASFLSQVLKGSGYLTTEQSLAFCKFTSFDRLETDYFLALVMKARAANTASQEYFGVRLAELKNQKNRLKSRLDKNETLSLAFERVYYSHWSYAAIHMICSQPQMTIDDMAEKLKLSRLEIDSKLQFLLKYDLVKNESGYWVYGKPVPHLSEDSVMNSMNHLQWRLKSVDNLERPFSNDLRYTAVFTCSPELFEEIRTHILALLKDSRQKIQESGTQSLIAMNIDFFKV